MATITLRLVKGEALTDAEVDANFSNLNRDTFLSTRNSVAWQASTAVEVGHVLNHLSNFYLVTVAGTTSGVTPPTHTSGTVVNGTAQLQYHIPGEYSAPDVLSKLILVDGAGSGLDADLLDGLNTSSTLPVPANKSSVVTRNSDGDFTARIITAALVGNVTGNVTGNLTGNVTGNVSGTSANVTGVVAVANGGTGASTVEQAQTNLNVDPAGTAVALAIALG